MKAIRRVLRGSAVPQAHQPPPAPPAQARKPGRPDLEDLLGDRLDDFDHLETWPGPLSAGQVVILPRKCWRCHAATSAIVGILVWQPGIPLPGFVSFEDESCIGLLAQRLPPALLQQYSVGPLRPRWSRTIGANYMSNGCIKCDAIQGAFPLAEELLEFELGGGRVVNLPRIAQVEVVPPLIVSGLGFEDLGYARLSLGGPHLAAELKAVWTLLDDDSHTQRWIRPAP